ncbi:MAG: hypothetical protein R2731_17210 [Nocardioides sp.]
MMSLAPDALSRLGRRLAAPAIEPDEAPVKAVVPQTYLIRTGPPDIAQRSLCRIFRWD